MTERAELWLQIQRDIARDEATAIVREQLHEVLDWLGEEP